MKAKKPKASEVKPRFRAYDPAKIEPKWQKRWAASRIYKSRESGDRTSKFYALDMFPYPSGEGLHVGHPKGYIATDVVSRFERMKGKSVLHPMGFDAFGLPAENYALKTKTNPADAVKKNVARFKKQLEIIGLDYDWSREVNTTDPKYYRWTQWIFLQLFKKGLAYESYEPVNWCPTDKTVLANEDVENGRCERCGTPVEKKPMRQWVLKITEYADRLLNDLDADDYVMPKVVDKVNPHRSGKPTVRRRVAHAIVFDPKNNRYLIIRNKKHDWDTVIIGGIEDGEDPVATARREVKEETGYVDIEFKKILGGPVEAHYYAKHKGENRIAISRAVLFELKSDQRVPIADGEDKDNEILWIEPKDFVHGKMINSELPVWLERLPTAAVSVFNGVPCFTQIVEPGAVREGLPFVERDAIMAIVKHWSEEKYIGLKWKNVAWRTLITGGPENGQSPEGGAIAEIIEETGYLHPKLSRNLGKLHSKFFHVPKNVNRFAHFDVLYFELKDGARHEISKDDQQNHEVVWLSREEMLDFLTPESHKYAWSKMLLGRDLVDAIGSKPFLDWPESIKEAQRNWIGRSEGALIGFRLQLQGQTLEVFTTRPDTIFGVTYLVLAPEHKLVSEFLKVVENKKEVEDYINRAKNETEIERTDVKKDKTGVELKGVKAVNPANNEEVPVWIADYVLPDYGTGAVMAVPAHDERDFEFAKKFALPVKYVIVPYFLDNKPGYAPHKDLPMIYRKAVNCYIRNPKDGKFLFLEWKTTNWKGPISGGIENGEDPVAAGKREIFEETGYKNVRFNQYLGSPLRADFYHPAKKENRAAEFIGLLFELENEDKGEVSDNEKKNHEPKWISRDQALGFINEGITFFKRIGQSNLAYLENGKLINSAEFDGKDSESIKKEITLFVNGKWVTKYKLRDWVFSRQRYWGEPIPIIHCEKCGAVAVPEKDLPVKLPRVKSYEPTGTGESPLANIKNWVNVKCPKCKGPAKRETNTMPQWAGSSWYYLRYEDPKNAKKLVDPKKEGYWSPVDLYVGGAEHATRHLIYARFWHKFLYDIGVVSAIEPFKKLQNVGLIIGEDGRKMSKRFGNVVNPDDIVKTYGADTLRIYEMFMGPFDQQIAWNTSSMVGARRFIERVWKLSNKVTDSEFFVRNMKGRGRVTSLHVPSKNVEKFDTFATPPGGDVERIGHENASNTVNGNGQAVPIRILHQTVKKVFEDIQNLRFNTAISALMILSNELEKTESISKDQFEVFLKLLAPFAPHAAEELWSQMGNKRSIHVSKWPEYDPRLIAEDEITIVVQVNGKVRGSFKAKASAGEEALKKTALDMPEIKKWTAGKEPKKVIVVKGKLVSIVV